MIKTEMRLGFEGYAPYLTDDENSEFKGMNMLYGHVPVGDMFSIVYDVIDQDTGKKSTISFYIDQEDAVSLKGVLEDEIKDRSWRSTTYYNKNVYMTCIAGSLPIISFINRGISIRFRFDEDYDKLLDLVNKYLESN